MGKYSGCQKNVPVFKRFFLQPYIRLCRNAIFRNIIKENGIKLNKVILMKTNRNFTAIIEREGDGYVSLCPELDIASQGETVEDSTPEPG